ncbi:MAG: hypothetical protein ACTHLE_17280 [Agriterribacter sp.]
MNSAKIQLSEDELRVALNAEFILTKNRIIQKVYELFGVLSSSYRLQGERIFSFLPVLQHPKIARGESYHGLPYVMLDYPRYFSHSDILAIRTMFWWGNNIGITLHLKGRYHEMLGAAVSSELAQLKNEGWQLQVSNSEWQHHYAENTHVLLSEVNAEVLTNRIERSSFVKLGNFLPLHRWNEAEEILLMKFGQLTNAVSHCLA